MCRHKRAKAMLIAKKRRTRAKRVVVYRHHLNVWWREIAKKAFLVSLGAA